MAKYRPWLICFYASGTTRPNFKNIQDDKLRQDSRELYSYVKSGHWPRNGTYKHSIIGGKIEIFFYTLEHWNSLNK